MGLNNKMKWENINHVFAAEILFFFILYFIMEDMFISISFEICCNAIL